MSNLKCAICKSQVSGPVMFKGFSLCQRCSDAAQGVTGLYPQGIIQKLVREGKFDFEFFFKSGGKYSEENMQAIKTQTLERKSSLSPEAKVDVLDTEDVLTSKTARAKPADKKVEVDPEEFAITNVERISVPADKPQAAPQATKPPVAESKTVSAK